METSNDYDPVALKALAIALETIKVSRTRDGKYRVKYPGSPRKKFAYFTVTYCHKNPGNTSLVLGNCFDCGHKLTGSSICPNCGRDNSFYLRLKGSID